MTEYGSITLEVRHTAGKGAARALRRSGRVPGVLYGSGQDNISVAFDPLAFGKATDPKKQGNTLFTATLTEAGKPDRQEIVMMTEIQRNALKADFVHVDFMRVQLDKEILRTVPVEYIGKSPGVAQGGRLKQFLKAVRVAAKPADIPEAVVVDITPLEAGQTLRLSDCNIPGVRIVGNPQQPTALVEQPKAKTEEPAPGAAPAAEAKKPA